MAADEAARMISEKTKIELSVDRYRRILRKFLLISRKPPLRHT